MRRAEKDHPIRVLIVEDSPIVSELLRGILRSDPEIEVVGWARNGREGLAMCRRLAPDVVTMDIRMPHLDGLEATRAIMVECPTPILVISSNLREEEVDICFDAIRAGAMDVVEKPRGTFSHDYVEIARDIIGRVKLISKVRPIRRHRKHREVPSTERLVPGSVPSAGRVVAVAASTGGPAALSMILGRLPRDLAWPVLLVQHIASGFIEGFAGWLDTQTPLEVRIGEPGERPRPGRVYLPSEGCHLGVDAGGRLVLDPSAPVEGHRPSATYLFRSVARTHGRHGVGVLLTGMGRDGAEGLLEMRRAGAATIAQDEATSLIWGMPGSAVAIGAAQRQIALAAIAEAILEEVGDEGGAPQGDLSGDAASPV